MLRIYRTCEFKCTAADITALSERIQRKSVTQIDLSRGLLDCDVV